MIGAFSISPDIWLRNLWSQEHTGDPLDLERHGPVSQMPLGSASPGRPERRG